MSDGNEIQWQPQEVANLAERLSKVGNEYRMAIADAYAAFNALGQGNKWIGKNYNVIARELLNASMSKFEAWSGRLQVEIPTIIYNIAEQQSQGGSISFSLTPNGLDISAVQETIEKADGSQAIEPSYVRSTLSGDIYTDFERAISSLNDYYNRFMDLGTLKYNAAIEGLYIELESEIIPSSKSVVNLFKEQLGEIVEKTIQQIELTNEETIEMARNLRSALNV